MKSVKNVYGKIIEYDNIKKAFYEAAKNKTERRDVKKIIENIDYHVKKVQEMLINTAPDDTLVPDRSKAFVPIKHNQVLINENSSKKVRKIAKPVYRYEQVIQHAIMQVISPIMTSGMYEFSCGSIPNRGAHYGKKYIEKWIKNDPKNVKYIAKMDIRHFYESIDQVILKKWLWKKIKDRRTIYLLFIIIDSCDQGLPLGYYTSQWFANFLLQPLDHYIKEKLHVKHYIRYLDDMVIFGSNKKQLHAARAEIERLLNGSYHLQMKGNWQVFRFDYISKKDGKRKGRPLDFMGFQFYRDKTIIRRSIMLRATRKAARVGKKEKKTWYDASGILSYMGWIDHTDAYAMYCKYIKSKVNVQEMKRIMRRHSRKENKKNDRMENGIRNTGRKAKRT